jgi:hypothetical protein
MKNQRLKRTAPTAASFCYRPLGTMSALGLILAAQSAIITPAQANTVWVPPNQRGNDTTTISPAPAITGAGSS